MNLQWMINEEKERYAKSKKGFNYFVWKVGSVWFSRRLFPEVRSYWYSEKQAKQFCQNLEDSL
jgi:hypothetical protein